MKKRTLTALLFLAAIAATAQTKINPATQVKWPTGPSGCLYAPATNTCILASQLSFAGPWNSGVTYTLNKVVSYLGSSYVSLQGGNLNKIPSSQPTYWALLVSGTGATFTPGAIPYGIDAYTSRAITPTDLATVVQTAANCNTAGKVWEPASGTCITAGTIPLTMKGDLFGFSTVGARIPVGADGQVLQADSTQTLGVKWAAGSGGFPSAPVYAAGYGLKPGSDDITKLTESAAALNHTYFDDGTDLWWAGTGYASYGDFVADTMMSMMLYPAKFTSAQRLNFLNKIIAAKNGSGEFPFAIAADGTAGSSTFYSGYDSHHAFATGDGWISAPIVLWQYYNQTGDLTPYTANVAAIKAAIAHVPQNASTHVPTVIAGNEYVPCIGFMEYMRFTSDVACAGVFKAFDMYVLGQMATAAGDSANATFFNAEYALIKPAIVTEFLDGASGMLMAASTGPGAQNVQIDTVSSVLAVFLESQAAGFSLLSGAQETAISNYIATNNSALTYNGFIRQSPSAWATVGSIPPAGGAPYGAISYSGTQYQGGFWGFPSGWYAYTLAKTSAGRALIAPLITALRDSPNPLLEWWDVGTSVQNPNATTLMTSPMGIKWAQDHYYSPQTLTVSNPCLNAYGTFSNNAFNCWANFPSATVIGWNRDTGFSRVAPGIVSLGNGTPGDASGGLNLAHSALSSGSTLTFPDLATIFQPASPVGGHVGHFFGAGYSHYNSCYTTFLNAGGSGSSSNGISLGCYDLDDMLVLQIAGANRLKGTLRLDGVFTGSNGDEQMTAGGGNYNLFTMNGNNANGTRLGFVAGSASTGDPNWYNDVPSGGTTYWRVNNVVQASLNAAGTYSAAAGAFTGAVTGTTLTPLYNASGTLQANAHTVRGSGTLSSSSLTVTLSGSAVFSSSSSYTCTTADTGGSFNSFSIAYSSGSSFTISSDATTPSVNYLCTGN